MKMRIGRYALAAALCFVATLNTAAAQEKLNYMTPPKAMIEIVDAPQLPAQSVSPDKNYIMLLDKPLHPSIEELSRPELKLAGLRFDPEKYGPSRPYNYRGMTLKNLATLDEKTVTGLPLKPEIAWVAWSPDSKKAAFTLLQNGHYELWLLDVASASAKRLTALELNAIQGMSYTWLSDSKTLLVRAKPETKGILPVENSIPSGPVVSISDGRPAPVKTYQDLLKTPYDEQLFDYYLQSQLYKVTTDGAAEKFPVSGIIRAFRPSPDGAWALIETIQKPYSYLVPWDRFPYKVELYPTGGGQPVKIEDVPLGENIPKGFNAVRTGRREFTWRSDADAELYWVEARDDGDPETKTEVRDRIFCLKAPFTGEALPVTDLKFRFGSILWGSGKTAVVTEEWWKTRKEFVYTFAPDSVGATIIAKNRVFELNTEDSYADPGNFATRLNDRGFPVLLMGSDPNILFLTGEGASPAGNVPFIAMMNLKDNARINIWESEAPWYETPVNILDIGKKLIITRRESIEEPPNYYIRDIGAKKLTKLTKFTHPYPGLKNVRKKVLKYKRSDGVDLTADLYLPPNYKEGKRLPVLVWAYPNEYKSKNAAGQVRESPYTFMRIGALSPLYWLTQGYAVLDDPSMPIVGEGKAEPNDSYIKQLKDDAEAAVRHIVKLGIADSNRIAVGGHSYGAFMAANLLAHTDLFAAGIARSGAYNRTLTPFGFQSEERTFWEAPVQYIEMSPFMFADRIKEPLLLIHGEEDSNTGTFPMQSERFFAALKGHGAIARLVLLPEESHGYSARESILHTLWEMNEWLGKYLKNN